METLVVKQLGLLAIAKKMAHDWIDQVKTVEELTFCLPTGVFEPQAPKGPDLNLLREAIAQEPGTPIVEAVSEPVAPAKQKKKRDGQVRKSAGEFTDAKREVIREKVGNLDLKSAMYAKIREGLCKELGLNRRQVTMYLSGIRKVKSGHSSIALARAAKTQKIKKSRASKKK